MTGTVLIGVYLFILAFFVGRELITKIPPMLHTPLMSGTNAISGITLVGALHVTLPLEMSIGSVAGFLAIVLAAINVTGGFLVTDRMLKMFRRPR
ncbi:MAG: NAD(P) transhydrogenase subunit alpha [Candidatus Aminicenantes bacterium]|nr:NAD(P) transhydrogenase subunit alpha [Candidatus Aminicenantes bacterium]NIN44653.1 NAD(P) transhydrogenase subunit alpha [Candidatus Aminicenantes bacterium]NIT25721.1 NAD(P) transhydrogenase subunit alpha [Candidatus Aminicenantes bacterium]